MELFDFEEIKNKVNRTKWYGTEAWYDILEAIGDCENKSRPHGEWINDTRYSGWTCTHCTYHDGNKTDNFCPNCGADMRGKEMTKICETCEWWHDSACVCMNEKSDKFTKQVAHTETCGEWETTDMKGEE